MNEGCTINLWSFSSCVNHRITLYCVYCIGKKQTYEKIEGHGLRICACYQYFCLLEILHFYLELLYNSFLPEEG